MDMVRKESSPGYGNPPWVFKGRALYQLHLVKSNIARSFIPKEFRLVEAFGYTLGGFFLANYDESPAGIFDELVVIAGIVWNPPTSCAWAARVLVDSDEACLHGRKVRCLQLQSHQQVSFIMNKMLPPYLLCQIWSFLKFLRYVGLPSEVARFSKMIAAKQKQPKHKLQGLFNTIGAAGNAFCCPKDRMDIQVAEVKGPAVTDICTINTATVSTINDIRMGPEIRMSLPSFSGRTVYCRDLLKYSCQITSRIRLVKPAKVFGPVSSSEDRGKCSDDDIGHGNEKDRDKLIASVMLAKPILALEFSCLNMQVEAPTVI